MRAEGCHPKVLQAASEIESSRVADAADKDDVIVRQLASVQIEEQAPGIEPVIGHAPVPEGSKDELFLNPYPRAQHA